MEAAADWKALGQVGGAVVAYAILVKVFEFIQSSRNGSLGERHGEILKDIKRKVEHIHRLTTRIHDRQRPGGDDDFDA